MIDKIKELLGLGLEGVIVASAVGCSESYVSQLLSDDTFAADVQALRLANFAEHASRDRKYDSIEDTLIAKLEGMIPLMARPETVLRAIATINGANRRAAPSDGGGTGNVTNNTFVSLKLPKVLAAQIMLNPSNQVVEVAGKTVASMPASGVAKQLEDLRARQVATKHLQAEAATEAIEKIQKLTKLEFLPVAEVL